MSTARSHAGRTQLLVTCSAAVVWEGLGVVSDNGFPTTTHALLAVPGAIAVGLVPDICFGVRDWFRRPIAPTHVTPTGIPSKSRTRSGRR